MSMNTALVAGFLAVVIAIGLCSRRIRALLMMIAMRNFFEQYMKRPRYRLYDPRGEEEREDGSETKNGS